MHFNCTTFIHVIQFLRLVNFSKVTILAINYCLLQGQLKSINFLYIILKCQNLTPEAKQDLVVTNMQPDIKEEMLPF